MSDTHLYQHPDGSFIDFDADTCLLMVHKESGPTIGIPIGPVGLVELGKNLIKRMEEDRYTRITLRIPKDVHAGLQASADARSHSMNAEIVQRVEKSLAFDQAANLQGAAQ